MPSSGVGGRVGASSLDGPEAEGTVQTGLGACAEEEAGRKFFPRPGHTGDTLLKPGPSQLEDGSQSHRRRQRSG